MKKVFAIIFIIILLPFLTGLFIYLNSPDFNQLVNHNPDYTAFMKMDMDKNIKIRHSFLPLSKIDRDLVQSIILAEDAAFWSHEGIDWYEVKESLVTDLKEGKLKRGASTISQQLIKNLYFTPQKSFIRKFKEMIYVNKLEKILNKKRILELYLNYIELGRGVYGVNTACNYYFDHGADSVSVFEAIRLAAVIPAPKRLTPNDSTSNSLYYRSKIILERLSRFNRIDSLEYQQSMVELQNFFNK
ncbi:MAG: monofunctional biosynthetic peptidoglycan transglycosylase [Calditrichia bacterium]